MCFSHACPCTHDARVEEMPYPTHGERGAEVNIPCTRSDCCTAQNLPFQDRPPTRSGFVRFMSITRLVWIFSLSPLNLLHSWDDTYSRGKKNYS